jgi:hypothetical protein
MCHFLPAALLILFEILLINAMSKNAKRKNMVNGSEQMKKKNNREKRLHIMVYKKSIMMIYWKKVKPTFASQAHASIVELFPQTVGTVIAKKS